MLPSGNVEIAMPKFIYKAKNGPVKEVEGELLAEDRTSALARIEKMGYHPIWVREKDSNTSETAAGTAAFVSRRDVNVFTRQLAGLIKSGIPILRALRTVGEQSTSKRFRSIVAHMELSVRDGRMLSDALLEYPTLFPELYVNMIRSGESAGALDEMLYRLAEARDREDELRNKVRTAMAYPMLVLIVGFITVFVMVTFFLPKIADLFRTFSSLPLPTRILIRVSELCSRYWVWVLVPLGLALAVLKRMMSGKRGRHFTDSVKLRLPLIGGFLKEADVARFARTMALLVRAGVPVEKALALSGRTLNNTVLRDEIEAVRRNTVEHGQSVADGLARNGAFPVFARNMIAVGEESGRIDESLVDTAVFYEKEVDRRIALGTSLIEPAMILVVGGVVGFIVFAMLLPILTVSSSIQ